MSDGANKFSRPKLHIIIASLSIANYLGADYVQALASLWSETDFKYDAIREVFLTKD